MIPKDEKCPCCKSCKDYSGFRKIADLKSIGLVIYQYCNRHKNENQILEKSNNMPDIIVLHNTKNDIISSDRFLLEFAEKCRNCERCMYLFGHAERLLSNIQQIDKLATVCICKDCRTANDDYCKACCKIANMFIASEVQKRALLNEMGLWLTKVAKTLDANKIHNKTNRLINPLSYRHSYQALKSLRNPQIGELFDSYGNNSDYASFHVTDKSPSNGSKAYKFPYKSISGKKYISKSDYNLKYDPYTKKIKFYQPVGNIDYFEINNSVSEKYFDKNTTSTTPYKNINETNAPDDYSQFARSKELLKTNKFTKLSSSHPSQETLNKGFSYVFIKDMSSAPKAIVQSKTSAEMIEDIRGQLEPKSESNCKSGIRDYKQPGKTSQNIHSAHKKSFITTSTKNKTTLPIKILQNENKPIDEKHDINAQHESKETMKKQKPIKELTNTPTKAHEQDDQGKNKIIESVNQDNGLKKQQNMKAQSLSQKKAEKETTRGDTLCRKRKGGNMTELTELPREQSKRKEGEPKTKSYEKSTNKEAINGNMSTNETRDQTKLNREKKETLKTEKETRGDKLFKNENILINEKKGRDKDRKQTHVETSTKQHREADQKDENMAELTKLLAEQSKRKEGEPKTKSFGKGSNKEITKGSVSENERNEQTKNTKNTTCKHDNKKSKADSKVPMDEINVNEIKIKKSSLDDLILQLVRLKQSNPERLKRPGKEHLSNLNAISNLINAHKGHKNKKELQCIMCNDSDLEIDIEDIAGSNIKIEKIYDIILGENVLKRKTLAKDNKEILSPILHKTSFHDDVVQIPNLRKQRLDEEKNTPPPVLGNKFIEQDLPRGVIRYALSDRSFIEKGWTMLPTEKVVRKINIYRLRPSHPEFDWFEHNKSKKVIPYDTGEILAEVNDHGGGKWFYRNGNLALDYYEAEEINAQQRFVVYSSGEPDNIGRPRPATVLASFDYLGNGIVFDSTGKVRLKYNQTEGVVLDKSIGPSSHWKWHTLNDPPVLQQVMIDTQMAHKDPEILKLGGPAEEKVRHDNEDMLAIEFDNFIKEKNKKLSQKFKPFQIKTKALKINENFSLKILDQATIYLIFRDGATNVKINIGMILDHQEIVDTDIAEVGEVSNSLERFPARTNSLAALQRSVAYAQRVERARSERERWFKPKVLICSADKLTEAISRPLRPPLRAFSPCSEICSKCIQISNCDFKKV